MRFLAIVKASKESEAGNMPKEKDLREMIGFNEQMVKAGVMIGGEGLQPTSQGAARIRYDGTKRDVVAGPFPETKDLVAGFWLLQAKSMDEALDWLKRAPFPSGVVELRTITEAEDFGAEMPPDLREQEERQRERGRENAAAARP